MRREDGLPDELVTQIIFNSTEVDGNHQPILHGHQLDPTTYDFIDDEDFSEKTLARDVIWRITSEYLEGDKSVGEMPIAVYQLWNTLDWRKPHDKPESAGRFISKLQEELFECLEAFDEMLIDPESKEKTDEFISELGDVWFCAVACATIARADTERGVAHELLEMYGQSVRFPTLDDVDYTVGQAIIRKDENYPSGQYPFLPKRLDNHEDEPTLNLNPHQVLRYIVGSTIFKVLPVAGADMLAGHGITEYEAVEKLTGDLTIFISFYSQYYANSSLAEVVKKNIEKISGRVAQGSLEDRSLRDRDTL